MAYTKKLDQGCLLQLSCWSEGNEHRARAFAARMVSGKILKICEIHPFTYLVMAAMSVANIVKTSLGPVGLDKMLVDDVGVSSRTSVR